MESFLPFAVIGSKNFFNKRFLVQSNDSKMVFINRKWNYLNRKWNYLSPFQLLYPKSSLTKDSSFQLFQNGFQKQDNELSKQATESFLPCPVIGSKNSLNKRFQNGCHKHEVELSKQEMELFLPINVHAIFWSQKIVQFDPFPSVNHSPYW